MSSSEERQSELDKLLVMAFSYGKVETYMLRSSSNSAWVKFLISLIIMEIAYVCGLGL